MLQVPNAVGVAALHEFLPVSSSLRHVRQETIVPAASTRLRRSRRLELTCEAYKLERSSRMTTREGE